MQKYLKLTSGSWQTQTSLKLPCLQKIEMTRPRPPRFRSKTNVVFHALGICRKTWSFASLMPEDFLWHFFSSLVFSPSLRLFAGPLPSRSAQMTSQSREVIRQRSVPFIFCASGIWQTSRLSKRLFQQKKLLHSKLQLHAGAKLTLLGLSFCYFLCLFHKFTIFEQSTIKPG